MLEVQVGPPPPGSSRLHVNCLEGVLRVARLARAGLVAQKSVEVDVDQGGAPRSSRGRRLLGVSGIRMRRRFSQEEMPMRSRVTPPAALTVPEPGTMEAIELGCTCRVIGQVAATDELEPAGVSTA